MRLRPLSRAFPRIPRSQAFSVRCRYVPIALSCGCRTARLSQRPLFQRRASSPCLSIQSFVRLTAASPLILLTVPHQVRDPRRGGAQSVRFSSEAFILNHKLQSRRQLQLLRVILFLPGSRETPLCLKAMKQSPPICGIWYYNMH